MLYDKEFLLQLDKQQHKVIYARITALTFQETPIEHIEGRVTQGSISLDGASAVRRTCSLTIAAQDFNHMNYYWGLNTKFKLEIGVENTINKIYPDIIWFNQGIYLITSFSTAMNTSSFNINIQGKDKMCLLNGDIGGSLESSIDFGTIEEEDSNGIWTIRKIAIPEIIKNLVHTYGGEPYHNIIIKDLESYGLELLEYRYDNSPLFLYRPIDNYTYSNAVLGGSNVYCEVNGERKTLSDLATDKDELELLVDTSVGVKNPEKVKIEDQEYYVAKIDYGQTAGYRVIDLVYAGDLIANVGDSITSVLDKIKTMLSEFEYFYNTDGQFVFQKKQAVTETMWQFDENQNNEPIESVMLSSEYAYKFFGKDLITAFNNNPNLLNLKNDYSIWGERAGISGIKIPIHLRYAIDTKPTQYTSIAVNHSEVVNYNLKYKTKLTGQESITYIATTNAYRKDTINNKIYCDWREIIYQMACDWYKYNFLDDFELRIAKANPTDYPSGRTGYEQYYIDLYSFWREIYYPDYENVFDQETKINKKLETTLNTINTLSNEIYNIIEADLKTLKAATELTPELIGQLKGKEIYEDIKEDNLIRFISKVTDLLFRKNNELTNTKQIYDQQVMQYENFKYDDFYVDNSEKKCWSKKVYEAPDQLNFWFDFLDTTGALSQFNVKTIGSRSKVINDTNIKSIYFRETPSVIYGQPQTENRNDFKYIHVSNNNIDNMFSCSAQGKSAKDRLDELLYQHSYCIESATITTIPIYHLEPNTRVYLHDEETGIDGDYIVSKLTIPLAYNGTMSITATKAAENIL